jgi:pimeloyl-ACP methyl ester carboxylesterase
MTTKGITAMLHSPLIPTRNAARALAATCTLLLGGLALSTAAHAGTPCLDGARCGSVTVPLDRANPSAGTIDVAYALLSRTDTSRPALGTIVPNPGGPGQSTIASAGLYTGALAPLRKRRDLLLIDPRGTGRSGALSCPSLAAHDPLSLDLASLGTICGADLGARAGFYGSAAVADDIDAVRAALSVDKLDLWGDSYGTFLMPIYAARHPEHVRSIVLDGAFPIAFDTWGRDVLQGVRRTIGLVCHRAQRCSGPRVLTRIGRLAQRLRRHPAHFTAHSARGLVRLTLGERELANVTYGAGDPQVYGLLPAAVDAALDHDLAPLKRLVAVSRLRAVTYLGLDQALISFGGQTATACHDYPRPFSLADAPADRRAAYDRALAALDPAQFKPFSADAWLSTDIEAGPKCLDWPADATAGSPLQGHPMPDVPVLVQSGEMDTNTPIEQGRQAAAQFAHPIYGIVADAGHTPDLQPCGVAMAIDFIEHLKTDANRCLHAGRPPAVVGRPALHAAQLPPAPIRAMGPVRRAVAVALATLADARNAVAYSGMAGPLDALRGGTYVASQDRVRFVDARVVTDATADGTETTSHRVTRTRLTLLGGGVPPARLALRSTQRTTRVTGTVAGRRVALRFPSTH